MTKAEAWREAERRWGAYGDPYRPRGWVKLRRRNVKNRCVVGWDRAVPWDCRIMGSGPTWEAAFAAADREVAHAPQPIPTIIAPKGKRACP